MSAGLDCLAITEDDITKMLAATTHIGSENSETTMEQYIFKKKTNGINIINLKKTWEKLILAARAIAAIENPQAEFQIVASMASTLEEPSSFLATKLPIVIASILLASNCLRNRLNHSWLKS